MSAFADVRDDKTLNEWLHEIAFVTSTMSDPDEPQSFQEAWWDPDLISSCRILGLTTLNSLLQYVNWLVWEVCSVN